MKSKNTKSVLHKLFIHTVLLSITVLFLPGQLSAQVAGTKSAISNTLVFSKNLENVQLDPTPLIGKSSRVEFVQQYQRSVIPDLDDGIAGILKNILGSNGFEIPEWLTDLTNGVPFFCNEITPTFNASASVEVGGYYETHSIGNADIQINYPVKVTITYPQSNTFSCGDLIEIETDYEILDSSNSSEKLKVTPPFTNQEIGPVLQNLELEAAVGIDAWVGYGITVPYPCGTWSNPLKICEKEICGNKETFTKSRSLSFDIDIPEFLPPFINVCESGFGPGANESSLLSCNWSQWSPILELGQSMLDSYNADKGTDYSLFNFPDVNTVNITTDNLPEMDITIPEMHGIFRRVPNTVLYQTSNAGKDLIAKYSGGTISSMDVDLVSFLDYNKSITTSFDLGSVGSIDLGDISPTITVDQTMEFKYEPDIKLKLDLGQSMHYTVENGDGSTDYSSHGQIVELLAGQKIKANFPENCNTPIGVQNTSRIDGNFSSEIKQKYYKSLQVKVGEFDIDGLFTETLIDEEILKTDMNNDKIIIDHSMPVNMEPVSLSDFLLDPENPVISVDYVGVEDIKNLGNGEKAVAYKLAISNKGDVTLNNIRLDFNLSEIFQSAMSFSVECLYSDDLLVNNGFDGTGVINLFLTENSLNVGESAEIEVLVKVKAEKSMVSSGGCFGSVNYQARAKAYGVSPIGTQVENNYDQCTGTVTGTDIIAVADMGASKINDIRDFAVYGWDVVKFDKPQQICMGNLGSGGDVVFENTSLQNNNSTVVIGDIHVGGQLFIQGESKVEADYVSISDNLKNPNWKSSLTLNGGLAEFSDCYSVQSRINVEFPKIVTKNAITVEAGETKKIEPGIYKSITLAENSEIIFTNGIYNVGRWAFLGNNSVVRFQLSEKSAVLNIETWQALGREKLQFLIEDGDVEDVLFNYNGKQKCTFNSSDIRGKIVAPNAEIEFLNGSLLEGSCFAKIVNFKTGSYYTGSNFLKPINIDPACQNVLVPGLQIGFKSGFIANNSFDIQGNLDLGDEQLKVYPNPTDNIINIEGLVADKDLIINIFNVLGIKIREIRNDANIIKVDLKNQPSGIYYIKIEGYKIDPIIKY